MLTLRYRLAAIAVASMLTSAARAEDWVVTRSPESGSCGIQPSTSRPILGSTLTTASEAEICQAASDLKAQTEPDNKAAGAADTSHCASYTPAATAFCKKRKIDLN